MFMKRLAASIFILMVTLFSHLSAEHVKAPDFVFRNSEGDVTFSSLLKSNKIALIYFGDDSKKSWEQLSQMDALLGEFKYRGSNSELLVFIGGKTPSDLDNLEEEHWLNVGLLADQDGKITKSYGVRNHPTIVMVDPFGNIQYRTEVASQNTMREKLNAYVDKPVVNAFCPVDKMWVVVTDKTPSLVYKGNRYYFCTSEDHGGRRMDQEFLQDPDRYVAEARLHLEKEKTKTNPTPSETNVLYECPMKDSPAQKKPGQCPKCGMLLQKVQSLK